MQLVVLVADLPSATRGDEGIVVVEHAKVSSGLRPDVVGLGGVNVGVIPAGRGQDVVVVGGIGHLPGDVDHLAIDDCNRGAIYQAVDERRVGILKNLLDGAGKLVVRLGPVMIFHRDHEHLLDMFRVGTRMRKRCEQSNCPQDGKTSELRHGCLQARIWAGRAKESDWKDAIPTRLSHGNPWITGPWWNRMNETLFFRECCFTKLTSCGFR